MVSASNISMYLLVCFSPSVLILSWFGMYVCMYVCIIIIKIIIIIIIIIIMLRTSDILLKILCNNISKCNEVILWVSFPHSETCYRK